MLKVANACPIHKTPRRIAARYATPESRRQAAAAFEAGGIVLLPEFWSELFFANLLMWVYSVRQFARPRDFQMQQFDSPRRMSVLGGREIEKCARALWRLQHDSEIQEFVESIVGHPPFLCTHPEECVVLNFLRGVGQTHGWHLDDPSYALVTIITAPSSGGGLLQLKPSITSGETNDPGAVRSFSFQANDAYLLRADSWLHRVSPITDDRSNRVSLNIAFDSIPDRLYGDTASRLYSVAPHDRDTSWR